MFVMLASVGRSLSCLFELPASSWSLFLVLIGRKASKNFAVQIMLIKGCLCLAINR